MSRWRRSPARDDRGFTLVELVVSISIISILAAVLVGVISVTLRVVPEVDARTDEARTLQGVVTWLPQDVDSTPPTGFDTNPAATSGCTLSYGTNLLRLEWTENVGAVTRFIANYRAVPLGSGQMRIERITCSGTGAGPLGNAKGQAVSSELPALPGGWTAGQLPVRVTIVTDAGDVTLVTFEVRTLKGKIVRTDSAPKNPANTLAPTTLASVPGSIATTTTAAPTTTTTTVPPGPTTTVVGPTTTAATTTTSTTTTTLPPCAVLSVVPSATRVSNTDPNGNGRSSINGTGVLQQQLSVVITTNGYCSGIDARATTGAPNTELFRNPTGSGPTYTIDYPGYPQGSSELWRDGFRTIQIFGPAGSTVLGSVTVEIR